MTEPVKRKIKVLDAQYIEEADSVLIAGECQEGRFRQQIHSSNLLKSIFGENYLKITESEKKNGMKIFAEELRRRSTPFYMVFDPDLNDKIEDNYPLKY